MLVDDPATYFWLEPLLLALLVAVIMHVEWIVIYRQEIGRDESLYRESCEWRLFSLSRLRESLQRHSLSSPLKRFMEQPVMRNAYVLISTMCLTWLVDPWNLQRATLCCVSTGDLSRLVHDSESLVSHYLIH